jgi:hypothetical protein
MQEECGVATVVVDLDAVALGGERLLEARRKCLQAINDAIARHRTWPLVRETVARIVMADHDRGLNSRADAGFGGREQTAEMQPKKQPKGERQ